MTAAAIRRAQACLAIAEDPAATEGERAAAKHKHQLLCDKYALSAADIASFEATQTHTVIEIDFSQFSWHVSSFAHCVGCGTLTAFGAACRACCRKAQAKTCHHNEHGWCWRCESETDRAAAA
ncbi:MAG: DUF2786 domain-containing protein [Pontixanthobacter sp.]